MIVKITLGGVEYTGLPLTLDALEEFAKLGPAAPDRKILEMFLSDPETTPRVSGPIRAFPAEIPKAIQAILNLSELSPGEAEAGATQA